MAEAAKKIVLGVSGGIAAYKSAELCRRLSERGYKVQVVMTAAAQQFITPLTFAALTGEKVITSLFAQDSDHDTLASSIEHIGVAQSADLLLVAPASADILAKFAHGLADDFLTTAHLAYVGPVAVAPAMNSNMWEHAATRENLATLKARGVEVIEPDSGDLACGMVGPGRLADPERIAARVDEMLRISPAQDWAGRTVLITAGPTREAIDPVRYISNHSSGRMGYALAAEALSRGARVMLVSGPVSIAPPEGAEVEFVLTAGQMHAAVMRRLAEADVVMMAAAVADYRPAAAAAAKIKKSGKSREIELEPTEDILAAVGGVKGERTLVGFAAETENLEANARGKMKRKHCDFVVANLVGEAANGAGFESDQNEGLLLGADGSRVELARSSKREMARKVLDAVG